MDHSWPGRTHTGWPFWLRQLQRHAAPQLMQPLMSNRHFHSQTQQNTWKDNLRKQGLFSLTVPCSTVAGSRRQQDQEAAGHIVPIVRKQSAQLTFLFLCRPGPQPREWRHPHSVGFPTSVHLSNSSDMATGLPPSTILHLVKLTVNLKHIFIPCQYGTQTHHF